MKRQMWRGLVAIGMGGLLSAGWLAYAAEHGGTTTAPAKEHGGTTQEHGGKAVNTEPSAQQIRQTIQSYVQGLVQQQDGLTIQDTVTGTTRTLDFVRVHDRVGKTGSLYYSCTDMRDKQTGELLDLDFDVKSEGGKLSVVDQRIHKVNGQPRYTYDAHDNRIPVSSTSGQSTQGSKRTY